MDNSSLYNESIGPPTEGPKSTLAAFATGAASWCVTWSILPNSRINVRKRDRLADARTDERHTARLQTVALRLPLWTRPAYSVDALTDMTANSVSGFTLFASIGCQERTVVCRLYDVKLLAEAKCDYEN